MDSLKLLRPAAIAAACSVLVACGGGGGDAAPAGGGALPTPSDSAARALAAGPALQSAPATQTGNVSCRNMTIGALRLDSIDVPADAACRLDGTVLIGNITIGRGATLDAARVALNGSVQAEGAADVVLEDTRVGGSVQIKQGGSARVVGLHITGDLQLDANRAALEASDNQIGGSLQALGNLGGLTIVANRMVGNLQCKENRPVPFSAYNSAASFEDQCAAGGGSGSGGGVEPPSAPLAGNVTCDGLRIGAIVLDTVTVPAGAVCMLEGTRLIGSILVGPNARLTADGVQVDGNLQSDGASSTVVGGASRFGGSVQVKQGGSASIGGASITGDLQIDAMAEPVSAVANTIGGNLQALGNLGGLVLSANRMGGVLQCKENLPAPTGSGNVATLKEDQCRSL